MTNSIREFVSNDLFSLGCIPAKPEDFLNLDDSTVPGDPFYRKSNNCLWWM